MDLIIEHSELFSAILRDRNPNITLHSLQELEIVTLLFYYLYQHPDLVALQLKSKRLHFQSMLLSLLAKYTVTERWSKRLTTMGTCLSPSLPFLQTYHARLLGTFMGHSSSPLQPRLHVLSTQSSSPSSEDRS